MYVKIFDLKEKNHFKDVTNSLSISIKIDLILVFAAICRRKDKTTSALIQMRQFISQTRYFSWRMHFVFVYIYLQMQALAVKLHYNVRFFERHNMRLGLRPTTLPPQTRMAIILKLVYDYSKLNIKYAVLKRYISNFV